MIRVVWVGPAGRVRYEGDLTCSRRARWGRDCSSRDGSPGARTSRSRIRVCRSPGRTRPNLSLDDNLVCILGPNRAFDHAWGSGHAPRSNLIAADITPLPRGLRAPRGGTASDQNRAATTTRNPSRLRCRVRRTHVVSGGSDGASMRGSRSEHSTATTPGRRRTRRRARAPGAWVAPGAAAEHAAQF